MKKIKVTATLELSPSEFRSVAGAQVMNAARQVLADERRQALAADALRPPNAALIAAGTEVARALTRYENSVGTRDERSALARLVAASAGLRSAVSTVQNLTKKES